jgi:hypothetical protein
VDCRTVSHFFEHPPTLQALVWRSAEGRQEYVDQWEHLAQFVVDVAKAVV